MLFYIQYLKQLLSQPSIANPQLSAAVQWPVPLNSVELSSVPSGTDAITDEIKETLSQPLSYRTQDSNIEVIPCYLEEVE